MAIEDHAQTPHGATVASNGRRRRPARARVFAITGALMLLASVMVTFAGAPNVEAQSCTQYLGSGTFSIGPGDISGTTASANWNDTFMAGPVYYYVHDSFTPAEVAAVDLAVSKWNNAATNVNFQPGGSTASLPDGSATSNIIGPDTGAPVGTYAGIGGFSLSYTGASSSFTFDVRVNMAASADDFHAVVLHELGHALGLDHIFTPAGQVMGSSYVAGNAPSTLGSQDLVCIRNLYDAVAVPTATPTLVPTSTVTPTLVPTSTPTSTVVPTSTSTPTVTPVAPTATATTAPSSTPTATAVVVPPTVTPTTTPTTVVQVPTSTPTATAVVQVPTSTPTATAVVQVPTSTPTVTPTTVVQAPTATATPTTAPSLPTSTPTPTVAAAVPTSTPTSTPTAVVSLPTSTPTTVVQAPTSTPTATAVTADPTATPTTVVADPTATPTATATPASSNGGQGITVVPAATPTPAELAPVTTAVQTIGPLNVTNEFTGPSAEFGEAPESLAFVEGSGLAFTGLNSAPLTAVGITLAAIGLGFLTAAGMVRRNERES